ncbi:NAD(P)-dependent oxidoreductase [Magnetospirillum sp. 15-1]|uniref:NAD-dependent epimerase/dehydratase family protein n=1 Tax=Magnetospirillum sp. 15-1 TaxID=1979370 RepID=UPI000BBC7D9F|nr:NAD(P)-dependent oxidoreductase [Magnetospirillum sp. 15-1]
MKVLLTGASSFTGCWFARALLDAGHEVVATFQSKHDEYSDGRRARIATIPNQCHKVFAVSFGDDNFLSLLRDDGFDVLCAHGAVVGDYRSPAYDVAAALAANTRNIKVVFDILAARTGTRVILTGSNFEPGEGAGSVPLEAFNPYGLAKSLTAETFRFYARQAGMTLGKFVISNPVGPHEEARFTNYLMRNWWRQDAPMVGTPRYVRDNIPVDLLARAYGHFLSALPTDGGFHHMSPSGYVETQGAFAERVAREMRPRLGLPCQLSFADQRDFPEPLIRINTDSWVRWCPDWDETASWDAYAAYYRAVLTGSAAG